MAKLKKDKETTKSLMDIPTDPTECPYREFRDNELSADYWGMGPAAFRAAVMVKAPMKSSMTTSSHLWVDDQTQPLPRSVRHYLNDWIRAEDLAMSRWENAVVIFEDGSAGRMSVVDFQLSHAQVLLRSSFCRRVLSACFMLERVETFSVEHQWENFVFNFGPEGWRAKYHIYSPGMKAGGGPQHRPGLSKSGCYLVRLYYLGAWRCVWVSDQVPVDAIDSPLLPFSPLLSPVPNKADAKPTPGIAPTVTASVVHLWPMLLCKALLKLAAPDLCTEDEIVDYLMADEDFPEFDVLHALTGSLSLVYCHRQDPEALWTLLSSKVSEFEWADDAETVTSTVKSKSTKKQTAKETKVTDKKTMVSAHICDTKDFPPFTIPGITPAQEMYLIVTMVRDVPLKKPLPEPVLALWKYHRWLDWARRHGLYEAYDCPRTKYLKVNGLLKLSYAPHLLDAQSTDSITYIIRQDQDKQVKRKQDKDPNRSITALQALAQKEELREWVLFDAVQKVTLGINIIFYTMMFQYTTASSCPSIRVTKLPPNRALDMPVPKSAPMYLQIDSPEENILRISLNMLHPRILSNCGAPIEEYIEKAYLVLELFEWFVDTEIPMAKGFLQTRGYDSLEVAMLPGRHFCRLWIHSRMNWHIALLSESTLHMGTRDQILSAATRECPWVSRFLNTLQAAFTNWIRTNRSNTNLAVTADRDFFAAYEPDLEWDPKVVGYDKNFRHWMFRQALQSLLSKKLQPDEYHAVAPVLRRFFCDPDFGLPPKPKPPKSLREIVEADPCDCVMSEEDFGEAEEEETEEQQVEAGEERPIVDPVGMEKLFEPPMNPMTSMVCELATEEVPCGLLIQEREKVIRRHEAATYLQAHWRGAWARKCLKANVSFTPEITKFIMEHAFGSLAVLSALMNEYFRMYPGAKYAYSVASGLSGVYGLQQHQGTTSVTSDCKWIPYFQGVFHCHAPVKVHFDIQSSVQNSTVAVYDNDTELHMPHAYNAHVMFHFTPNKFGYTVMSHGTLSNALGHPADVNWQLTVMSSADNVFHICDNESEPCAALPLPSAAKLRLNELYLPNRRNILGEIQISVTKIESVSFRATATCSDLEIEAILYSINEEGEQKELGRCPGNGEICWPFIRLKPNDSRTSKTSQSQDTLYMVLQWSSVNEKGKDIKQARPVSAGGTKSKSATKIKDQKDIKPAPEEPKLYKIEVIAPNGWPLPLAQWRRVNAIRNSLEPPKAEAVVSKKSAGKEKGGGGLAKDMKEDKKGSEQPPMFIIHKPLPDDAFVELEVSTAVGGSAVAKRDDERDLLFALARRDWDAKEPGRNARGAQIREAFRAEFLLALPTPWSKTTDGIDEMPPEVWDTLQEALEDEATKQKGTPQSQTPITESSVFETIEEEEEATYYTLPEQLRDKFVPLYFVPLCTREKSEEIGVLLTPEMAEAAKTERLVRLEAALERMHQLQQYNEVHVLGRQRKRCRLLEQLYVDGQWRPELSQALHERDDAIARETLERSLSAAKKGKQKETKADTKKKTDAKQKTKARNTKK